MLNHKVIKLCLFAAVMVIFLAAHISLQNFNQDTGFTPPLQMVSLRQIDDSGWRLAVLGHSYNLQSQQLDKLSRLLSRYHFQIPAEQLYQLVEVKCRLWYRNGQNAVEELGDSWQRVLDGETLRAVKCRAANLVKEFGEKD
ncbi:aminoglycoside phosphotransferase family enzyme [Desulfohalotomaculum tongense]|uniref:hypothetical protein n=1 Tax=Desulforadius tongensis TaxID=1216062 RepID=UPI001957DC8B|nr:hypothetical protein [Desulforadius tongensis]MBM7855703.1 aminoglycoside phosphotransferase family enzyme [Desulforadius tongensis]